MKYNHKCDLCKKKCNHELYVANIIGRGEMVLCVECMFYMLSVRNVIYYEEYDIADGKLIFVLSEFFESKLDEKYI